MLDTASSPKLRFGYPANIAQIGRGEPGTSDSDASEEVRVELINPSVVSWTFRLLMNIGFAVALRIYGTRYLLVAPSNFLHEPAGARGTPKGDRWRLKDVNLAGVIGSPVRGGSGRWYVGKFVALGGKLIFYRLVCKEMNYGVWDYGRRLIDVYIFKDLGNKISRGIPTTPDAVARVMATLERVSPYQREPLKALTLNKVGWSAHSQVEPPEAPSRDASAPIHRSTFGLPDQLVAKAEHLCNSLERIQFSDQLTFQPNQDHLGWACAEDLSTIPPKSQTSVEPNLGSTLILTIRRAVAIWMSNPKLRDHRLAKIKFKLAESETVDLEGLAAAGMRTFPTAGSKSELGREQKRSACISYYEHSGTFERPTTTKDAIIRITGNGVRNPSLPLRIRPLVAPVRITRSLSTPNPSSQLLPTLVARSTSQPGLKDTPTLYKGGISDRSSSSSGAASKGGVCRFLSKPCQLLLNDGRSGGWTPYGGVNVEVRKLDCGVSRLSAMSTRSHRNLLRLPLLAGLGLRKSNNRAVEVDRRDITYRFVMEDQPEADELVTILAEALQSQATGPPLRLLPPTLELAPLTPSDSRNRRVTRLVSATCKLFILRDTDHTWSKVGQSQLELVCFDLKRPLAPKPPAVGLLIRCFAATRQLHLRPRSFRCERLTPKKLLVVHLDRRSRTTTLLLKLPSKRAAESLLTWVTS
ncbi:hypothetical protein L0F63_001011 [Massospora cicadina]|nr:hypothetical protein L0F63_001011 [Massospora cicadina]